MLSFLAISMMFGYKVARGNLGRVKVEAHLHPKCDYCPSYMRLLGVSLINYIEEFILFKEI
jgi:hypothetical protein